jgi:hypothetical protein
LNGKTDVTNKLKDVTNTQPRRHLKDPPKKAQHLNIALVNKTSLDVGREIMELANLQQPEAGVDLGGAYATTFAVNVSNVVRTHRNGGLISSGANEHSNTVSDELVINIIAAGGARGIKVALPALKASIAAI